MIKVITTGILVEDHSQMINRNGTLVPHTAVRATKVVKAED